MAEHHKEHPDYVEMGVFAGYGEFDGPDAVKAGVTRHEIGLQATSDGWHWTLFTITDDGPPNTIAESFHGRSTAAMAAADAEAEIAEPGRALRLYRECNHYASGL